MEITNPKEFTKYEKARLIGARALQIAMGAPILIKLNKEQFTELRFSPINIAKLEFEKGAIPLTIRRPEPAKSADAEEEEE
ncbi:DNA-directed RNA polymerase subunit K [archaeon]|nr:DNA-directed RNA polymerase subunit K [archaeon]